MRRLLARIAGMMLDLRLPLWFLCNNAESPGVFAFNSTDGAKRYLKERQIGDLRILFATTKKQLALVVAGLHEIAPEVCLEPLESNSRMIPLDDFEALSKVLRSGRHPAG